MSAARTTQAPRWVQALLRAVLGAEAAPVIADLNELFQLRVDREGVASARRWYIRQGLMCTWRLGIARVLGVSAAAQPDQGIRGSRWQWLRDLPRDTRVAARSLLRRPTYTLAVALTLGIGLAGVSIVYSVANWVLLRPVPGVTAPDELALMLVQEANGSAPGGWGMPFSHADALDLAKGASHLGKFTAATPQEVHFGAGTTAEAERIPGEFVWPNYFELLGVKLQAGRTFASDSIGNVAIISERLARRFHADARSAVGSRVTINGRPYTVIGVASRGFHGPEIPGVTDVWLPQWVMPEVLNAPGVLTEPWGQVWASMIVRPVPGVRAAALQDALNSGVTRIRGSGRWHSFGATIFNFKGYDGIGVRPGLRSGLQRTLSIVAGAAVLLLLLTGANAANLALSRNASLGISAAVQRALGASNVRIVRERLIESALLGFFGALASVSLTWIALRVLDHSSLASGRVSLAGIRMNATMLLAGMGAAVVAGAVAGLLPALLSRRTTESLRSARHGDRSAKRIRGSLVIAQVALSIVLLVAGGLLARTMYNLREVDFGFEERGVAAFSVDPGLQGYDKQRVSHMMRELVARIEAEPGVRAVAVTDHGLTSYYTFAAMVSAKPKPERDELFFHRRIMMSPSLLEVLDLRIVAGGVFASNWLESDSTTQLTGMLSESGVRRVFPGLSPSAVIGRQVSVAGADRPVLVTGVVEDAALKRINGGTDEYFYQPWSQGWEVGEFTVYVKAAGSNDVRPALRRIMHDLDPTLPLYGLRTLTEEIDVKLVEQRFVASLALALAATGIILVMLGLYGTLSCVVLERTRELGVRAALGAAPRELIADVVRDGLQLATIGVVVGVLASAYVMGMLAPRLYGVRSFDAPTYLGAILLLVGIALSASLIPGARAARIDPLAALRTE